MRKSACVFYFAGREFEGLPLTGAIYESRHDVGLFIYGTCEIPPGQAGGCAPPVQIQIFRFNPTQWARAMGCHQKPGPPARHLIRSRAISKKAGYCSTSKDGPDRDRTCDLGIKSPGGMVAACGE
jgi:hypothetical protein